MIRLVHGNMFDCQADALVNTVNCVGVMGAGVALQFKNRYPDMFQDYVRRCRGGLVRPGQPYEWRGQDLFGPTPIIINFPTKDNWRHPSEYEWVSSGLAWLREYLLDSPGVSIAIPAVGCGLGGLDWSVVLKIIQDALGDLPNEILVFPPQGR